MERPDPLKHRLTLWLKSEQALGVPSVGRVEFPDPAPRGAAAPHRATPQSATTPARPAQSAAAPRAAQSNSPRGTPAVTAASPAAPALSGIGALPIADEPFAAPPLSRDEKIKALQDLDSDFVKGCTRCGLSRTRDKTVFGEGDPDAQIMFIGEGPGKDEDATGRPFVGRAGQKLNDMIGAMGLKREHVFIANIVKCRAFMPDIGKDRPPSEEETAACVPYLIKQAEVVRPKVIVTLGLPSTRYLLKSKASMTSMRGTWHAWRGIRVMPTWHPAYVLRNYTEQTRREVWDDLKKVLVELGLPIPKRSGKQD
jgi:DNA polymerase